jgi:ferredoxin--NADP+ reductase
LALKLEGVMSNDKTSPHHLETVTWVHHWTPQLLSFRITRPPSFRFRSGEFVMIGLPGEGKPILRAYSIACPSFAEELEFLSIKVPNGPLTSRLQRIEPGDQLLLGRKATGTLVLDALKPGEQLVLIGTGTGLAPFLSIPRDPETYERFARVIVTHTVRDIDELVYRELFETEIFHDELIGDEARTKLVYYPTVTRAPFHRAGRITTRIETGDFFKNLDMPAAGFDPARDRAMLCGSMAMNRDVAAIMQRYGLQEGSNNEPGDYVLERAFVG